MKRLLLPTLVALAVLAAGGTSAAQGPGKPTGDATVEPVVAGKGSKLTSILRGRPDENQTPRGASLKLEQGFKVDRRAILGRCTAAQAGASDCPADSRVGSGNASAVLRSLLGDQPLNLEVSVFAADPETGETLGLFVTIRDPDSGQQSTARGAFKPAAAPFGVELLVDPLPQVQNLPPGFSVLLGEARTRFSAKRTVKRTVRRTVKRKVRDKRTGRVRTVKRRVKRRVKTTYNLIKNPRGCDGAWAAQTSVRFDDRTDVRDFEINCARGKR